MTVLKLPASLLRAKARRDALKAARALSLQRWLAYQPPMPSPAPDLAPIRLGTEEDLSMPMLRRTAHTMAAAGVPPGDAGPFGPAYQASIPAEQWDAFEATPELFNALCSGEIAVSPEPWFTSPAFSMGASEA